MSISSQALGIGSGAERKLKTLLANANPDRAKQLEKAMQTAVDAAIKEGDLSAANVNAKIAAHLKNLIPELNQP